MKLIVGLGNIGKSYQLTRHNIGFIVLDALSCDAWTDKKSHFSFIQKIQIENETVWLAKPQTQMNLSGRAVQKLVSYYQIKESDLLVVHDDIDSEFLTMKFQINRGSGGHNGVQDIHDMLGHKNYYRLKMGVGRPGISQKIPVDKYVLSSFDKKEFSQLEDFISQACLAVHHFVVYGGESAGNKYNQKEKKLL